MTKLRTISRKVATVAIAVSVLGLPFAGTAQADFKIYPKPPIFYKTPYFPKPKPVYMGGYGYGAAALAGGLALGTMAATFAARADDDCTVVRRIVEDDEGNQYVRHVRVCE